MKQEIWLVHGKKHPIEIVFEGVHIFNLADRYLKVAIINMFKEPKEIIFKELKDMLQCLIK